MTKGYTMLIMLNLTNDEARKILGDMIPRTVKDKLKNEISKAKFERIKR